jgi:hypothetical protein
MDSLAEPSVRPTVTWAATQLVPSPELAYGDSAARFGMRWQVTPLLYSWGIHRGLSPWRFFIAEPLVRQGGSIELYFTPEYVVYGRAFENGWIARTGVRSYFPLIAKGDYLSVSVGASHVYFDGRSGAAIEGGAYILFGVAGVQLTYSPSMAPLEWIATFRIRYF